MRLKHYPVKCTFALPGWISTIILTFLRRVLDKESNALTRDRDRQSATHRSIESELHRLELESAKIRGSIKEKENIEKQIEQWKKDIADMSDRMKASYNLLASYIKLI